VLAPASRAARAVRDRVRPEAHREVVADRGL